MTLKGPEFKKALLLGLVAAVVPLFFYPHTFGWSGAAEGSPKYFLIEWVYYILAFRFFFPREPLAHRLKASMTAFAFRLSIGFVWAVLAGGLFNFGIGEAMTDGMFGYLPCVLLHVALTPMLLRPVFRFRELRRRTPIERAEDFVPRPPGRGTASSAEAPSAPTLAEAVPDFDAAVAHVASYSTVELAVLVDEEGLSVARVCRGGADADLWAPVVNLVYEAVQRELRRTPDAAIRRFEVTLSNQRLVVERVAPLYLAVLFDHTADELVNVRIAQAVDMVKRYYEYRYPKEVPSALTEVAYV